MESFMSSQATMQVGGTEIPSKTRVLNSEQRRWIGVLFVILKLNLSVHRSSRDNLTDGFFFRKESILTA